MSQRIGTKNYIITNSARCLTLWAAMLDYLQVFVGEGSSNHTAKAKRYDLTLFHKFAAKQAEHPLLTDFSHSLTKAFVSARLKQESPSTVARRLWTVQHFGKYCSEKYEGFMNPTKGIKAPRWEPPEIEGLTHDQVAAIRSLPALGRTKFLDARNRVILELGLLGLRAFEIQGLQLKQLDAELTKLHRVHRKANNFQDIYLSPRAQQAILKYLVIRDAELGKQKAIKKLSASERLALPLIISPWFGAPGVAESWQLSLKAIWRVVNEAGKKAGIKGLHPHLLRHTFGRHVQDKYGNIRLTAQALGHQDPKTTMRYTSVSRAQLKKVFWEQ